MRPGETHGGRPRGRRLLASLAGSVLALTLPLAAGADRGDDLDGDRRETARVPAALLERATADPHGLFQVIVQGTRGSRSADVGSSVAEARDQHPGGGRGEGRSFHSITGVSAEVTGKQLVRLAGKRWVAAITEDAPVRVSAASNQKWPYVSGVAAFASGPLSLLPAPTIAVVDSGIDSTRADFAGRVVREVTLTSLPGNSPRDGRGHGTFVASIAAGGASGYTGAAPRAQLVSIDVTDDAGMALTSDVIAAADWILANKAAYGIRVANFSLHSTRAMSFRTDPLDKAVERLWLSGVVVVAAAGNYAVGGQASGIRYAPANDPFVITVGATDIGNSMSTNDDVAAPWSAHGSTVDGFAKPELAAPGRYMVGAAPPLSALALERPDRVVAPGYMQLSGTSFAAPVVAGAAADLLAVHPAWTPDQVKGALMASARALPSALPGSQGIGEVNALLASTIALPPNPNASLNSFLVADPLGGPVPVFDDVSWTDAATADPLWDSVSWTDVSWTDVSWTDVSWTDAAVGSVSWTDVSWTDTSTTDSSFETSADSDALAEGGYWITPEELDAAEAELGIADS